jgi:hypothetical protein
MSLGGIAMADTTKLVDELTDLDEAEWVTVMEDARAKRSQKPRKKEPEPKPGISREAFADWVARRHLASDPGLKCVTYLPAGAPPNEVRLVEQNALLTTPQNGHLEPVDFSPGIQGIDFDVFVLDVTPEQWTQIRAKNLALPQGWSLEGFRSTGRKDAKA